MFVLDWKTNSLSEYDDASVEAAMEKAGYHLQYMLYALAVRQWLGKGQPDGIAYLFVRGGEISQGAPSGVYARPMTAELADTCRQMVLKALNNNGKEE